MQNHKLRFRLTPKLLVAHTLQDTDPFEIPAVRLLEVELVRTGPRRVTQRSHNTRIV